MAGKRKTVWMTVRVTAPGDMPAGDVRREVRSLIHEGANWRADAGDIKCLLVAPIRAEVSETLKKERQRKRENRKPIPY